MCARISRQFSENFSKCKKKKKEREKYEKGTCMLIMTIFVIKRKSLDGEFLRFYEATLKVTMTAKISVIYERQYISELL